MSEARGWDIVPPTILRDGPFGEGMVQAFVEPDVVVDVIGWVNDDDPRLRRMAAFDAAVNNTTARAVTPAGRWRATCLRRRSRRVLLGPPSCACPVGWRGELVLPDELAESSGSGGVEKGSRGPSFGRC